MNILVICHYGLYQDLTFSFVHNQIREYAALGHRVRVLIPIGVGKSDRGGSRMGKPLQITQADGVELYDLRYVTLSSYGERGFNTASAIMSIRLNWKRIFDDFTPDVIHAHTLGFDSEIGSWLKDKWGCPLVVTSHGSDAVIPLEQGRLEFLRSTCDKADAVIAVSNQLRDRIRTCGTATPVETIHNGFILRELSQDIQKNPYSMIQVGHLIPSKRTDVTIRAFAQLKKEFPSMGLTIIGAGYQRQMLEQLAAELGVADSVKFLGQIPNRDVFSAMEQASYFVMASKPEGFGIVYLEAMAAGCIVIGTEGEGIADIIRHGENGFLVPADDPERIAEVIRSCTQNPDAAASIAENGQTLARQMTWSVNAKKYLDLFTKQITNSHQQ